MADIDEKVLARRQKDVNGFTEHYQAQLEKAVGDHMQDMAPQWARLRNKLTVMIENLYKEAGETKSLDKATTLLNKADRLISMKKQIETDLKIIEAQQQPYYTSAVMKQFEQSYYSHAWGLEQAAQVSVNIPLLTPMQVLGVAANPWLEDGANYSERLRANTAYLAQKMKKVVDDTVKLGYSVNEAARKLQDTAQEGYFNSVRLIRTEVNRAANLGASYMFMQNADILDGKRWNATLDARTAAKDAANDGEIFDLDYDTPENKGVPGKRIPNHPHCRCKYSPVLSALGVSTKERIARGAGDTKDHFGERTYTQARTYREYAKERGLPDLDERLAKENPKQYLRPTETIADLNKKVVRVNFNGAAIVVARPVWEAAKAAEATTTPKASSTRATVEEAFPVTAFSGDQEVANAFYDAMENAPAEYRDFAIKHFEAGIKNIVYEPIDGSFYRASESQVHLDPGDWQGIKPGVDDTKARRAKGTLIHEVGHGLDYGANLTNGGRKWTALSTVDDAFVEATQSAKADYSKTKKARNKSFGRITNPKTLEKALKERDAADARLMKLRRDLEEGDFMGYGWKDGKVYNNPRYACLSDIFSAITNNEITGGYGHSVKYWKRDGAAEKEIFANLYELHVHHETEAIDYLRSWWPDIVDAFVNVIKTK